VAAITNTSSSPRIESNSLTAEGIKDFISIIMYFPVYRANIEASFVFAIHYLEPIFSLFLILEVLNWNLSPGCLTMLKKTIKN
jgi:hypothetical protein